MNHKIVTILLALLFAFWGGATGEAFGALAGLAIGVLAGLQLRAGGRLRDLEQQVAQLRAAAAVAPGAGAEVPPPAPQPRDASALQPVAQTDPETAATTANATATATAPATWDTPEPAAPQPPRAPLAPGAIERGIGWLKTYMSTGNVVAKVGVLVLFVGVSFLLKYAVERNALPIEVRLAATAAGALALLVTGWRLRATRGSFGMVLQGGGIGILYLTVFAAARLYHVLPMGLTFALLLALVALSAALAVLQDARALATVGTIGGFLAPVLTSTGGGSHVALFSYYAALNAGILGIAWFRAWRILNWVGFMFTFVIGAAWGYRYYQPEYFASTEPFLVLSFFFYLAVSVLFAHRHPPQLRGYVDGTLVFGLPLACFALQAPLVRDIEFGRAWTAAGMAAVYLMVARWLWSRRIEHLRMLVESQLALGVVAASLVIPFAFDGHVTAAGWALEGAGLVWIGIRQQRPLARAFGLLLQFGAGMAFFAMHNDAPADELALLNTRCLGAALIAIAALLASLLHARGRAQLLRWEAPVGVALLAWGLLWWAGGGLHEIGLHVGARHEAAAILLFGAGSTAALTLLAERLAWRAAALATLAWVALLALFALSQFAEQRAGGPLAGLRWLGWPAALAASYLTLRRSGPHWLPGLQRAAHAITLWTALLVLTWAANWSLLQTLARGTSWAFAAWGVLPAAAMLAMLRLDGRLAWPLGAFRRLYLCTAQAPVAVVVLLWVLWACTRAGNPYPLDYLPLLNPLDLAQAGCLLMLARWWVAVRADAALGCARIDARVPPVVLAATAFLWLNAATARGVYFLAGVPFTAQALHHSPLFQLCISVLWGVTALGVMFSATRIGMRALWLSGAALLAALVLKLFFIDLAASGTVARILSFMVAGALMVLIGYLSPAPPSRKEQSS